MESNNQHLDRAWDLTREAQEGGEEGGEEGEDSEATQYGSHDNLETDTEGYEDTGLNRLKSMSKAELYSYLSSFNPATETMTPDMLQFLRSCAPNFDDLTKILREEEVVSKQEPSTTLWVSPDKNVEQHVSHELVL
jgi:hypothetical protein